MIPFERISGGACACIFCGNTKDNGRCAVWDFFGWHYFGLKNIMPLNRISAFITHGIRNG